MPANKWLTAASVFTGAVMGAIDTFVLYVATPHLRGVFSSTTSEISWISTGYSIAALVCMLVSGWLARRYGGRNVYQFGILAFIMASVLCGLSTSLAFLVCARVLQGAAAGILIPVENLILRATFPPEDHGKVIGVYSATIMAGPALGPMLGGYIIDNYHWSQIFFINVPIGLLGLAMMHKYVPKDAPQSAEAPNRFDWWGAILLIAGIFCLVWLLERGDRLYWFQTDSNLALLFVSLSSLSLFVAHELSIDHPIIDLRVLKNRKFSLVVTINFLLYFIVTATLFILPIYMQDLLRFSPSKAGTTLAPRAFFMMAIFPLVGSLFGKVNPKILVCSGLVLGAYSGAMMTQFTHETGTGDMLAPLVIQGIAVVLLFVPLTTLGLMHVQKSQLPAAAALDATTRQLGAILGIAVFASLLTHYELAAWGEMRPNITLSQSVLYQRFGNLNRFFEWKGASVPYAREQATKMLSFRFLQQVRAISYRNLFQIVTLSFAALLALTLFCDLRRPVTKEQAIKED